MKLGLILATAAGAVAAGTAGIAGAAASAPAPCAGSVVLTAPPSNLQISAAGPNTFVELDFVGLHDICFADGSRVLGEISGHVVQRNSADGDLTIRFDEILSYGGGSLGFRGEGGLSNGAWRGHVRSVGAGTGPLAGIHGQGEFWPTGPTSFDDVISYVYGP